MGSHISKFAMVRLSEYAEIKPGFAFKSDRFTDNSSDISLVKGDNVQQGYIDWAKAKFWNSDDVDNYRDYLLAEGDIVVAMDRPWVNAGLKWAFIKPHDPKCLLVQRVARLRAKRGLSQGFLRYLVSSEYFASYIEPIVTGVNVPHISGKQIGDFRIPLPEIEIQKKIAALLAAYDDLIENNKRRITLLENMAEEIYREWFVRFRFPGWQEAVFEKGQPANWMYQKIAEAFDFTGGGTPSKDNDSFWRNGDIDWYTPSDITKSNSLFMASSEYQCNEEGLRRSSAKLFPAYSVMMTSRATIGAIGINTKPACTNQGFITCIPNEQYPLSYLYHWLKAAKPHFEMLSGGATFPELIKSTFKRIEILSPDQYVIEKFDELVSPIFKQVESLAEQNQKLEQAKNQLLPRLISGKLSVENLDIQFPPSMQSDESGSADEADA